MKEIIVNVNEWVKDTCEWFAEAEQTNPAGTYVFSSFPIWQKDEIIEAMDKTEWAGRYIIDNINQMIVKF